MNGYSINFVRDSKKAVRDKKLQKALFNTTNRFRNARENAVSDVENWETLRDDARQIKKHTIENLDKYLEILEQSITENGGKVHWAEDSYEATKIIGEIALNNKVSSIVKSKSMATEEVELNPYLESIGLKVIETDLGEYIIQLAGEHPSHIIAPAIHKTKDDISKLFSEKLDIPYYEEPEKLTEIARQTLRNEFLNASMGISGANFAVADTGTIVIVENEGNARLTTTLPKIHVALVGIEKLIPRFEHLPIFLSLLARSATGQKSSTYVSYISGPRKEGEIDGPQEFHLILLDNGRTKILESEETRESLYCIRCGACLNICPVYRHVGGHTYGWVYSGPIGAIITPQLMGIDKAPELPFASSLCGACRDVCPVKIDIPKVLLELRKRVIEKRKGVGGFYILERLSISLWKIIVTNKFLYNLVNKIFYYLQKPWKKDDSNLNNLPFFLSHWTKERHFPVFSKKTFTERWKKIK